MLIAFNTKFLAGVINSIQTAISKRFIYRSFRGLALVSLEKSGCVCVDFHCHPFLVCDSRPVLVLKRHLRESYMDVHCADDKK